MKLVLPSAREQPAPQPGAAVRQGRGRLLRRRSGWQNSSALVPGLLNPGVLRDGDPKSSTSGSPMGLAKMVMNLAWDGGGSPWRYHRCQPDRPLPASLRRHRRWWRPLTTTSPRWLLWSAGDAEGFDVANAKFAGHQGGRHQANG